MTIVGAVSPAGGDFSEPITQHSLRLAGTFWALDTALARQRHFPAIDWNRSYTLYGLARLVRRGRSRPTGRSIARWARELLQREAQLLEVVQLLGADTLAPPERVVLQHRAPPARGLPPAVRLRRARRLLRSAQAARDAARRSAPLDAAMSTAVGRGAPRAEQQAAAPSLAALARMREWPAASRRTARADVADRAHPRRELEADRWPTLYTTEHRTVSYVSGPLIDRRARRAASPTTNWSRSSDLTDSRAAGQVLEIEGDRHGRPGARRARAASTSPSTTVLTRARAARMPVGPDLSAASSTAWAGPIDGGPPLAARTAERDLNGLPVNPVARAHPSEFIETGISAIDGLHTLVRGQKLPDVLRLRAARRSSLPPGSPPGRARPQLRRGIRRGLRRDRRDRSGGRVPPQPLRRTEPPLERSVVFINRAEEPAAERLSCPRAALTAAEYLAFERGLHVLVVLVDMTELLRGAARVGRRPGRGAGPARLPRLHVLRPRLAVRTGGAHPRTAWLGDPDPDPLDARRRRHPPDPRRDGLHHRGPDRALPRARPARHRPADRRAALAEPADERRHRGGQAPATTTAASPTSCPRSSAAAASSAASSRSSASRRSPTTTAAILAFVDDFERRFVGQGAQRRSIEQTLDLAWGLLARFPADALKRISPELVARHHHPTPSP